MNQQTYRRIIHLDLDAFYCSVEEILNPELKGKPFAVGGSPQGRGVVSSCSYAARQFGVRSAMPMARAIRLCPQLLVVRSHFSEYRKASSLVMERLRAITPLVEQISIDEAFLDVSDLRGDAEEIARELQKSIRVASNLPCSLGVASNKLVAKIANDVGKSAAKGSGPPNAITVVPHGREAEFLAPLPAIMLWGVGPKTAEKLAGMGIHTIGDIAAFPEARLGEIFGKHGYSMSRHARGIDNRPIVTTHDAKSISHENTFSIDVRDETRLRETLHGQVEKVVKRLRKKGLSCRTVKIKLRWPDFTTLTRQSTLSHPSNDVEVINSVAQQLLNQVWSPGKSVRLIGMGVSGFEPSPKQLSFWDLDLRREQRLQKAVNSIREKFGKDVLMRGVGSEE